MNNVRSDVGRSVPQQRLFRPLFRGALLSGVTAATAAVLVICTTTTDDGGRGSGWQQGQGRRCGTKSGIRGMILRCPVGATAGSGGRYVFVIPDFPFEILAQTESEGLNSARTQKSFGKKEARL